MNIVCGSLAARPFGITMIIGTAFVCSVLPNPRRRAGDEGRHGSIPPHCQ
jgi:hypothetical protein